MTKQQVIIGYCLLAVFLLLSAVTVSGAEPARKKSAKQAPAPAGGQPAQKGRAGSLRVALVIGNGNYAAAPLQTPVNDARTMAATLSRLGFTVELQTDLGAAKLKNRIEAFGKRLQHGGVGFFYFAGHGAQVKGVNYLLPVDVRMTSATEIRTRGVEVERLLAKMERARSGAGMVVLDASHTNPLVATPGLASMTSRNGRLIAFAVAPGKTVVAGAGPNSIYAEELSKALETPGLNVTQAFKQVRQAVLERTAGAQAPWEVSALEADFPFIRTPTTGIEMVNVPGGCFQMGDTFGDGASDEQPVHEVCVSDFAIGKYEVTQGLWRQVMGSNPSHFSRCGDDCPVENVSWFAVQEFITRLNESTGGYFRLPTEAEWEYAARSGGRPEKHSGGDNVAAVGWYGGNSGSTTHPVGQKQANGLGIFDMSGNVWEWVEDWQGEYPDSRQNDPIGPPIGSDRVARGGCWGGGAGFVRTTNRFSSEPGGRNGFLGFRLAMPLNR